MTKFNCHYFPAFVGASLNLLEIIKAKMLEPFMKIARITYYNIIYLRTGSDGT